MCTIGSLKQVNLKCMCTAVTSGMENWVCNEKVWILESTHLYRSWHISQTNFAIYTHTHILYIHTWTLSLANTYEILILHPS